jgi:hypothetical protein
LALRAKKKGKRAREKGLAGLKWERGVWEAV